MTNDIRMRIVDFCVAKDFIAGLEGKWIYIKFHNRYEDYTAGFYSKFRVNSVQDIDGIYCYIYGYEDDDRLVINWKQIIQTEITDTQDELLVRNEKMDIYIKKYNPRPDLLYQIPIIPKNLIITEGKTDWKILKAALSYYNSKGKFLNWDISFLEYEDELCAGNSTMVKVRDYNAIIPNDSLRIFVFDADDTCINNEHEGKEYVKWANGVYSFILPVPDHRRNTPLISIENLFTDEEIKTSYNGRRLYLSHEFDEKGRNKENPHIMTLETKETDNHVIDHKVYYVEVFSISLEKLYEYSKNRPSIALSKNDFAESVLNKRPGFDNFDFSAFEKVFEIIDNIYRDFTVIEKNIVNIGKGIDLEKCHNGFFNLYLNISFKEEMIEGFGHGGLGFCGFEADSATKSFCFIYTISLKDGGLCEQRFEAEVTEELIGFLLDKCSISMNRIIVNIFREKPLEIFSSYEILKGETCSAIIKKELNKYWDKAYSYDNLNIDMLQNLN